MGKKYDDIDGLLSDLKSDIQEILQHEVLDEVKDMEMENVQADVYSYSPTMYSRRGASGGIGDDTRIVGKVNGLQLEAENMATFNPGYGTQNYGIGLADLINDGNGAYRYDYYGSFTGARPFIKHTQDEIDSTERVDNILFSALKAKNY